MRTFSGVDIGDDAYDFGPDAEPDEKDLLQTEAWLEEATAPPSRESLLERIADLKDWQEELIVRRRAGVDISESYQEFAREMANFASDCVDLPGADIAAIFGKINLLIAAVEYDD